MILTYDMNSAGCAINAIKFAVMRNKACCEKLIDVGGLKYVFSLLAGKGVKKSLKRKGSGEKRFVLCYYYICIYVCVCFFMFNYVCMYVCMCIVFYNLKMVYVCMYVCIYTVYVQYVCIYACVMYECINVCFYVCMYVHQDFRFICCVHTGMWRKRPYP